MLQQRRVARRLLQTMAVSLQTAQTGLRRAQLLSQIDDVRPSRPQLEATDLQSDLLVSEQLGWMTFSIYFNAFISYSSVVTILSHV
jgi:hypothetical protein